ncbi:helix-turn-helix transcriptional regulator [Desulfurivibrio dismutans]|uniref:helix-turn-helix transcriptional regulator n=1 Tax=Desulfurivibrio dismutans TaxID=1398908 RepID=UPI0023DA7236|nr:WYL domain-containing protein [Desulfurivibrio alkaliphilus]MDF1614958.1 WYL domain-containing protein [Desulfurivibrio alkaliphilus]
MGDNLVYARYHWFDREIRRGRFPNVPALAAEFGITERTARRAIAAMRDDFDAPLQYLPARRGYIYSDDQYRLPAFWLSQEEIFAVLLAKTLLSCCADGLVSQAIASLNHKLLQQIAARGLEAAKFDQLFSATWPGYAPAPAEVFRPAARALLEQRLFSFTYSSPLEAGNSHPRLVEPHHLQHYMGNWVLLARCHLRRDWRKFVLSRMENPQVKEETFTPRPRREWLPHLEGAYGIFQGNPPETALIRFTPARAPWIKEQLWHPDQRLEPTPNGGLLLTLPVADYREIKLRLLQFGAEAEVLQPAGLREEIAREAQALAELYRPQAANEKARRKK